MSEVFTTEWITRYQSEHPDDTVFATYSGPLALLVSQHAAAVALVNETSADNVAAVAAAQWESSDTPEAAAYRDLRSKIDEVMAKLQPQIDRANDLRDRGVESFTAAASEYAQANGANAVQNEARLRAALEGRTGLLSALPYAPGQAPEFPTLPRPGKAKSSKAGGGNRGRKAGSLDWHLATATINGNDVSFTGDNVTLSAVAKSLGITRNGLDDLLRATLNGNVDSPKPGESLTVTVTVNNESKIIAFVGRETKPRGRKPKGNGAQGNGAQGNVAENVSPSESETSK